MNLAGKSFELLAPGGDLDSILAAIASGADAVYCGLDRFNARNRATNLTLKDLLAVIEVAHANQCQIFLTLNIMLLESEVPAMLRLLNKLVDTKIDGVIVQDLGLAYLLKHHFPTLDVHASTQMNTHNNGQIEALSQLGTSRVNVSRELNLPEIAGLAQHGREHNVLLEAFVHGSYCIGFSGLCYISSTRNGASGNRGRCSQPCRDEFAKTATGHHYPMNMKDNTAFNDIEAMAETGVYSLKIEGRIKQSHYVYTTVKSWREQIDALERKQQPNGDSKPLYTVFNRDFSAGYLNSHIGESMYIDNPRNNAAQHRLKEVTGEELSDELLAGPEFKAAKQAIYDENTTIIKQMKADVAPLRELYEQTEVKAGSLKGGGKAISAPSIEQDGETAKPRLSVLLSDWSQVEELSESDAELYIQLPNALRFDWQQWVEGLKAHPQVMPYFPAVLIGEDFDAAISVLEAVAPKRMISDNLGLAFAAQRLGIEWFAGKQLNIANSYSLECLKQEFSAGGAFISSELNFEQLKRVVRPKGQRVFYSLFHPNTIMTSRQCLFMRSEGCRKTIQNKGCLRRCEKRTSIINLNDSPYIVNKRIGEYNQLFSEHHTLVDSAVAELGHLVTDFLIDMRDVVTETRSEYGLAEQVAQFEQWLAGNNQASQVVSMYNQVSNKQYMKGV